MRTMHITKKDILRFFSYTQETNNGCIEWTAAVTYRGYGRFWFKNKNISSHRFSWMIQHGEITCQLNVCHSCDNRKCVNWKHLWLGTHQDNAIDRSLKKRNGRSKKFTDQQEQEIANYFYTTDTIQRELALKYNTTREHINVIIRLPKFRNKYGKKIIIRTKKITAHMKQEIISKHRNGEHITNLSKYFNVSRSCIRYYLKSVLII